MIHLDALEARYAGRAAFIDKLLQMFVSTHARVSGELRDAVEAGDSARVAGLAHALKGSAGNVMDTELMALARDTEEAARRGQPASMALAADLAEALDQTLARITATRQGP